MAGHPTALVAILEMGLLSIEPGPSGIIGANGRHVIVGDHVLFVTQNQNHAVASATRARRRVPSITGAREPAGHEY